MQVSVMRTDFVSTGGRPYISKAARNAVRDPGLRNTTNLAFGKSLLLAIKDRLVTTAAIGSERWRQAQALDGKYVSLD